MYFTKILLLFLSLSQSILHKSQSNINFYKISFVVLSVHLFVAVWYSYGRDEGREHHSGIEFFLSGTQTIHCGPTSLNVA